MTQFLRDNARTFLLVFGVLVATAACDGGCSGCEGCGVAPIPGGYPIAERIPNSAQMRLTSSGVQFLEDNIGPIVTTFLPEGLDFPIERQTFSAGITFTICSDNDCVAHAEIPDRATIGTDPFVLTPSPPNQLLAHIRMILDSRNMAGMRDRWDGTCDIDIDTRRGSRQYVGLIADIQFVTETQPARQGYTKVQINSVDLASGEGIENDDLRISGGFLGSCGLLDLNFIKGFIIDRLASELDSALNDALGDQLCTTRGEYGCPTGTFAVPDESPDSVCRYGATSSAECVPTLLGTDGQGDLGAAFLGGFSPGTHAPGQFVLAAGGDGQAVNDGMTLDFYGGYRGTNRTFTESPAHNPCVPLVDPPPLPTIPQAAVFRQNSIPGGGEAHVAIGLSEQYLNYTGYGLFDSGMLCIGAGTRLSQQITTGLFSVLISSLKNLAFPQSSAPLSLSIRPQEPPVFEIGAGTEADALLGITLPNVEIDFYVWSSERYVRFMTYKANLTIPINLTVEDGAIAPQITAVTATDSSVTNSELLREDPDNLADIIETVISSFAGMLTGSISPFELPEISGFELTVPPNGIQGIEDGGDEFLAIFANLAVAPSALTASADTWALIDSVHVEPEALALETFGQGEIPWVRIEARADGPSGVDYEYSYRLDGSTWRPWTTDRYLIVQERTLLLQARHQIDVRARIAGQDGTQDQTPASVEVIIDALAPDVTAARLDSGVHITATDVISPADALEYRFRKNAGAWTEWQALGAGAFVEVAYDDTEVDVEVRDEAGNVGSSRAALIRGLPNPEAGDGCGCSAPGQTSHGALYGFAFLVVFGLLMRRRGAGRGQRRAQRPSRRGRSGVGRLLVVLLALQAVPLVLGAQGCDCGDDTTPGTPPGPCDDVCPLVASGTAEMGSICCEPTDMCVDYNRTTLCDPGFECPAANIALDDSCGVSCSECVRRPALAPGLLATYLDMVVTDDGSIVFSGYSPGVPPMRLYGDLVVGTYSVSSMSTTWEIVDGAPSSPITNDPDGYRGGVSEPGDDVGRWTSIVEGGGNFYVAYHDETHTALKMAIGSPGGDWTIHTVDDEADAGRYTSMILDAAGAPLVAYLRIQTAGGSTEVLSSVLVAQATSANPAGPADWTVTEVSAGPMPCRQKYCASGTTCLEDSGLCVEPTSDCTATCGSDRVCFMGGCQASLPSNYVEDMPPARGLFPSLARTSTGLALVWYDRVAGNIMGAAFDGAAWGAPFLIDGYGVGDPDVGDSGMWASLYVDAADVWHVAYVDGAEEAVRYARVEGGAVSTEQVDDGSTDGTMRHSDGRHIVGDDASIVVTDGGQIRIAYQDATSQRVMLATRGSGDTDWNISILDDESRTGWWVVQRLLGTTSYVGTWWRDEVAGENGVRVLTVD